MLPYCNSTFGKQKYVAIYIKSFYACQGFPCKITVIKPSLGTKKFTMSQIETHSLSMLSCPPATFFKDSA